MKLPLGRFVPHPYITTRSNGFYLSDDYRDYRQMLFNLFKMLNKAKQFARGYILTMTTHRERFILYFLITHPNVNN